MEGAFAQESGQLIVAQHAQAHLVAPVIERPVATVLLLASPHGQLVAHQVAHHGLAEFLATLHHSIAVPATIQAQREVHAFFDAGGVAVNREEDIGATIGRQSHNLKQVKVVLGIVGGSGNRCLVALVLEDFLQGQRLGQVRVGLIVVQGVLSANDPRGHMAVIAVVAAMTGVDEHARHILLVALVAHLFHLTLTGLGFL